MEGLSLHNSLKFLKFGRFMKVRIMGMVDLGEGERFVVMPCLATINPPNWSISGLDQIKMVVDNFNPYPSNGHRIDIKLAFLDRFAFRNGLKSTMAIPTSTSAMPTTETLRDSMTESIQWACLNTWLARGFMIISVFLSKNGDLTGQK